MRRQENMREYDQGRGATGAFLEEYKALLISAPDWELQPSLLCRTGRAAPG